MSKVLKRVDSIRFRKQTRKKAVKKVEANRLEITLKTRNKSQKVLKLIKYVFLMLSLKKDSCFELLFCQNKLFSSTRFRQKTRKKIDKKLHRRLSKILQKYSYTF